MKKMRQTYSSFTELLVNEYLKPQGLSINELTDQIHVSGVYLNKVIRDGKISPSISARLGVFFGKTEEYFYNLQDKYYASQRTIDIYLTFIQIRITINALDLYSRIWIGQYDHLSFESRFYVKRGADWTLVDENEHMRNALFLQIRSILLPRLNCGLYGSYGIWSSETDNRAKDAYDMQQVIRYKQAYYRHPEGGNTVDFREPMIEGRYPRVVCRMSGKQESPHMRIYMYPEQFDIYRNAVQIYDHFAKGEYRKLFAFYTDNEKALDLAKECEKYNNNTRKRSGLTRLVQKLNKIEASKA